MGAAPGVAFLADPHAPGEPAHPGVPLAPPGIVPESDVRTHSPAAASPQSEHGPLLQEDLGELPKGYGDGRLVCLIRDPTTVYVYWDLSQQQIDQAFGGLGQARAQLKLWSLRSELLRETEVHLEARGWYVRELAPGSEFRIELWALGERGARMLRAGRPVRLPAAKPSDVLEEFYAVLPVGMMLPKDGQISGGRPLAWRTGTAPPDWERRDQPRFSTNSSRPLPWSGSLAGHDQPSKKTEGEASGQGGVEQGAGESGVGETGAGEPGAGEPGGDEQREQGGGERRAGGGRHVPGEGGGDGGPR